MHVHEAVLDRLTRSADLDSHVDAVLASARRLRGPRCGAEFEHALRESAFAFVKNALGQVTILSDNLDDWPRLRHQADLLQHGLQADLLKAHARQRAGQWRNGLCELIQRLESDWTDLVDGLALPRHATWTAVSAGLGDLHHHGRSVYRLDFDGAPRIIYKPRPVDTEAAFGHLVQWLQMHDCPATLKHCPTVAKDGYGWMAFIPTLLCETPEETQAFCRRQGAFLALGWRLGSHDMIAENVIVHGAQPMWVDTECMFSPMLPVLVDLTAFPEWTRDSIATTGMLVYGPGRNRGPRRLTGLSLCCAANRADLFTDRGAVRDDCIQAVARGFEEMYLWLLTQRDRVCASREPLAGFADCRVRVLLRSTDRYAGVLPLVVNASSSSATETMSAIEEMLTRGEPAGLGCFPVDIVREEMRALACGDVPCWYASANSRAIREVGGDGAYAYATADCLENLDDRGRRMSEADLQRQSWLLTSLLSGIDP